jgi:hypothetical protein
MIACRGELAERILAYGANVQADLGKSELFETAATSCDTEDAEEQARVCLEGPVRAAVQRTINVCGVDG